MCKKTLAIILTAVMLATMLVVMPLGTNAADNPKNLYDATVLPNGNIAILYISSGEIYFGLLDPGTNNWNKNKIAEGKDTAFDLDSSGYPHVVYITNDDNLGYIYYDGSSWSTPEIIDSIAFGDVDGALSSPDIAIDSSGNAHISFLDAKGGYTGSNNYSSYEKEDLVYATNMSGNFIKEVVSYSHGWFYSPDGWRNLVYAPTKITLINNQYSIGVKQYQYDKWMGGQYHTYNYNLYFPGTSLSYEIRSASTNNDLGFKLFGIDSDGSTVYSLFNKSGSLYVLAGISEVASATKTFAANGADLYVTSDNNLCYAGISASSLLLYQSGEFKENITLPASISTGNTRMTTLVYSAKQYVLYTDTAGDLWVCDVSTDSGDSTLNSFMIPDKLPVTIDGVTVDTKEYDGEAVIPGGNLTVTGGNLTAEDLLFTYTSTDGAGYSSTTPPVNAGNYKLVISVPEENQTYIGSSSDIPFSITQRDLTVMGTTAINRDFEAGNIIVALNTENSSLSGVISVDEGNVSLDKSGAEGTIADADAAVGKAVTVTGFALTGTAAANYSLIQPTDITVNINPITLSAPAVALNADSANGGLSVTVSDSINSAGVSSYTVEIYLGTELKKTITGNAKNSAQNIPLESNVIVAEHSYTAKAMAVADASGNYLNSAFGNTSDPASAAYSPLIFSDSVDYDIPASYVGTPITPINVSSGVTGGKLPYSFSSVDFPSWASISNSGIISGTPGVVASEGTATITVTDSQGYSQNITIAYGAVGKGSSLEFQGILLPTEKTYGDEPISIELTYDGQAGNVTYTVLSGPGNMDGNTLTFTGAGNVIIRVTGTSANYADKIQDYTIQVNRKTVTITPTAENNTKVYGEVDPALSYTHSALVSEDSLSGTILERAPGENTGVYDISIAGDVAANNPNYLLSLATGTHSFTITKKPISVTNATISAKPYDGTVDIAATSVTGVGLNGDIDGMILGIDFEILTANYTDHVFAGTNKPTLIIIGLKDTIKANNYTFVPDGMYTGATADITATNQIITASDQSLTVTNRLDLSSISSSNASGAVLTYSIAGNVSDYASLSGSILTGTSEGVVTIHINSAAVDVGGTSDDEYSAAAEKQISVTVSAKENGDDTITFNNSTLLYGEGYIPNPITTLTNGAWSYHYSGTALDGEAYSSNVPPCKAGSYMVTAKYENSSHIGMKSASLTISPKPITISGIVATDRPYNGTISVNITGGVLEGLINDDTVTVNIPATGVLADPNVGSNKVVIMSDITLSGPDRDNYLLIQPNEITVSVFPKEMTFAIDSIGNQDYSGHQITPDPVVKDGSVTLLRNTDYTVSYESNVNAGLNEGSVIVTGIGNYQGSTGSANFTINKIAYTGAAITGSKQVFANTVSLGITYMLTELSFPTGFVDISFDSVSLVNNEDGLITNYLPISNNTLHFDVASCEAGKSATFNVVVSSTNFNDYLVAITVNTVNKTPVVISGVTVADKTYDGSPAVLSGAPSADNGYSGSYEYLYKGTGLTVYSSEIPPTNAGSYNLIVRIPLTDPTYTGQQNINFTINKAELKVKPANMSIFTNDALPTPLVEFIGLQGSDAGTEVVALSSGNLDMEIKDADGVSALSNTTTAGQYTIKFIGSPVFNETTNYTITIDDGILTIQNRPSGGGVYELPAITVTTEESPTSITNKTVISAAASARTATVSISTSVINALLVKANQTEGTEKGDVIGVFINTFNDTNQLQVNIQQRDLAKITTDTDASLAITSSFISLQFDAKALETVCEPDSGANVVISASVVNNNFLSEAVQKEVQGRPVYDLTVINGNKQISDFRGGHATVTIPYELKSGENPSAVVIFHLADDGTLKAIRGHYNAKLKAVVFKTNHFSKFVISYNQVSFSDVLAGAWYKNAVEFIAARSITSGTGPNKFSPQARLTRAQFVVLLMNAYRINTQNEGEFDHIRNFTDAGSTYYTDYLLAAKGLGVVNGVGNNFFAPDKEITRQEMLVMLYNALQVISEVPATVLDKELSSFSDAGQVADWANEAVSALVKAGIVGGSNNRLNPTEGTTRAEIAQVLYNLLSK
jgi:hypothetical protein